MLAAVALALVLALVRPWAGEDSPPASETRAGFDPPDAVPANSEYVESRVLASGKVRVDHWIRSTRSISDLVLSLPLRSGSSSLRPTVRGVKVESDQGTEAGPTAVGTAPVTFDLDGTSSLHVSYLLSGVVVRSSSAPGRTLVRLTSLDLTFTNDRVPKTVMVSGGRLLAAACQVEGSTVQPRPCGDAEGDAWRVRLEPGARHDRVMAQLDLPDAQAASFRAGPRHA